MVVDNGDTFRFEVAGPACRLQFLQSEKQVDLALSDERRPYLPGDAHVAEDTAAALCHTYGIGLFYVVAGGDGRLADDIAGQDNSLTSSTGNQ